MYVSWEGMIGCVVGIGHKLRLLYEKGHECYLREKEDGVKSYRRTFSYSAVGDQVSPSGEHIQSVEWIRPPSTLNWIWLRYLNFGYAANTMAKVLENQVHAHFHSAWVLYP